MILLVLATAAFGYDGGRRFEARREYNRARQEARRDRQGVLRLQQRRSGDMI